MFKFPSSTLFLLLNCFMSYCEKNICLLTVAFNIFVALNCLLKWTHFAFTPNKKIISLRLKQHNKGIKELQASEQSTQSEKGVERENENWVFQFSTFRHSRFSCFRVECKENKHSERLKIDWLWINSFNCNYFSVMEREIVCLLRSVLGDGVFMSSSWVDKFNPTKSNSSYETNFLINNIMSGENRCHFLRLSHFAKICREYIWWKKSNFKCNPCYRHPEIENEISQIKFPFRIFFVLPFQ